MDKATLIQLRTLHQSHGLSVFCDNAKLYTEVGDGTFLMWDDTNEILHVVKPNNSHYNQRERAAIVESVAYEQIQYISSAIANDNFKTTMESFKTNGLITNAQYDSIINFYKGINNKI
jgi:hypothetical protein